MGDVDRTIEAVWKIESTRFIAAIARVTRDVGIAEELAQDALVAALERWPKDGIPENPAAWLMTVAKRLAIDSLRRGQRLVQKHEDIGTTRRFNVDWPRSNARNGWAAELNTMLCRRRLPPVTCGPAPPKRPTGIGSFCSTTR